MAAPTNKHIQTGQSGEDIAVLFLQQQGYFILQRNYRHKRAEVDIIAQKDNLLVFVEVKTRSTDRYGFPEEAVNFKKEQLLLTAAEEFIENSNWLHDIRFDIISITLGTKPTVHHIEDAFH
ncbi:YraN family protein [Pontibacter harenae]|uniref:YraN family protein n=1 Tax=Pontibacter harenae TaxID=2894083 RepID=UPI001E42E608|nr:YraN family protein [Pontibacter harenae]